MEFVINILKLFLIILSFLFCLISRVTIAGSGGVVYFSGIVADDGCNVSGEDNSFKLTCYDGSNPRVNKIALNNDVNIIADDEIISDSSVKYINKKRKFAMLKLKYN
ncbi:MULTISPECIES: hypothetical protein [Tatumella]|uniref:Type 1 fimbrial protein n=1 Tax=Tatumella punctata TaxID=399969 RepID=A0ABW1VRF1_9GAMM|nr:hypothetical protein [Tatumella sp. JGM130]MBS0895480.1 hypothetical protein [Tatumella sp. JGM130]